MSTDQRIIAIVAVLSVLILGYAVFFLGKSPAGTSEPADLSVLVRPDSNKIASDSAKVTIVEFGDYQCPACAVANPVVKQLVEEYQGRINFVFRHFPLPQHQHAMVAAKAAEAAGEQGKFWQMHHLLYENQTKWENSQSPSEIFTQYAREIGLNEEQFKQSLNSDKFFDKINGDRNDGNTIGVNSTPTFYINGVKTAGFSAPDLKQQIDKALQ